MNTTRQRLHSLRERDDRRADARANLAALIGAYDKVGISHADVGLRVAYVGQQGKLNITPLVEQAFGLIAVDGRLLVMEMELIELLATNVPLLDEITLF